MDFDFVEKLNKRLNPLGVTFSITEKDSTYTLVAQSSLLAIDVWTQIWGTSMAETLPQYFKSYFTPKSVTEVDANTTNYLIGSVFDIIKEITNE